MLTSLLNMSVGCLVLQCYCVPLITLTHLELRLRVHSPMVFLLQMGLSCRFSIDLVSRCSCGCRDGTVGTVPVTNSCTTSQNITDVSIRNMLSENMRRLPIPCKTYLDPRIPSNTHYRIVLKKITNWQKDCITSAAAKWQSHEKQPIT